MSDDTFGYQFAVGVIRSLRQIKAYLRFSRFARRTFRRAPANESSSARRARLIRNVATRAELLRQMHPDDRREVLGIENPGNSDNIN
ncbi:hypothetical protein [Occallatibacter savannae]|uniref:hypothetical protein n=1 Tax=Occallatibacter savannae TaxID=1002691 RepID=UPI000D68AB6B|nr:hypothetical protein [Occallatibacter savannae]